MKRNEMTPTNQLLTPQIIRNAVRRQTRSIQIGRSQNSAHAGSSTPIVILKGSDCAPHLCGQPYLKTNFSRNGFSKTLYTYSTLRIEVGADWNPYDRD